jgi:hypothetical protein
MMPPPRNGVKKVSRKAAPLQWGQKVTYAEYEEMRTAAASRVAVAPRLESREDVTPLKGAR